MEEPSTKHTCAVANVVVPAVAGDEDAAVASAFGTAVVVVAAAVDGAVVDGAVAAVA